MSTTRMRGVIEDFQNALTPDEYQIYWERRARRWRWIAASKPSDWDGSLYELDGFCLNLYRIIVLVVESLLPIGEREENNSPILDIGCGAGRVTVPIASRGYSNIHAVDFSPTMLRFIRQHAQAALLKDAIKAISGDARCLVEPSRACTRRRYLRKGYYQLVIGGAFFLHQVSECDWLEALRQAKAATAPGGYILIYEPMMDDNPKYWSLREGLKHYFTRIRWERGYLEALDPFIKEGEKLFPYCSEIYRVVWFKKPA